MIPILFCHGREMEVWENPIHYNTWGTHEYNYGCRYCKKQVQEIKK